MVFCCCPEHSNSHLNISTCHSGTIAETVDFSLQFLKSASVVANIITKIKICKCHLYDHLSTKFPDHQFICVLQHNLIYSWSKTASIIHNLGFLWLIKLGWKQNKNRRKSVSESSSYYWSFSLWISIHTHTAIWENVAKSSKNWEPKWHKAKYPWVVLFHRNPLFNRWLTTRIQQKGVADCE